MRKALVLGIASAFMLASGAAFAEGGCGYGAHTKSAKGQTEQSVATNQSLPKPAPTTTQKDTKG